MLCLYSFVRLEPTFNNPRAAAHCLHAAEGALNELSETCDTEGGAAVLTRAGMVEHARKATERAMTRCQLRNGEHRCRRL